jgi:hypothetical protein
MLSVILSSRVKNNLDTNVKQLLDSVVLCVSEEDYDKIELIIKYDADDDCRPPDSFFDAYPFVIKRFVYERGEGRHYNHHYSEYGFANRNTSFKWAMSVADDFFFIRKDFLKDLAAIQDEYMVVGFTRPTFEINAVKKIYDENFPYNFDHENGVGEYCPCLTANLVEICQNMGWQSNIDAWVVLLETKLFEKYGFLLWKQIEPFYKRTGSYGLGDTPVRKGAGLYNNMSITGAVIPKNKYLFKLIEQQATNVYLNIVYGKLAPDQKAIAALHEVTPVVDPQSQIPSEGWEAWDAPRYNDPPIFDWYQTRDKDDTTYGDGRREAIVCEDEEKIIYEICLIRGTKVLFNRRNVDRITMVNGAAICLHYNPETFRVERLHTIQMGDDWVIDGDGYKGILALPPYAMFMETVTK